MQNVPRWSRQQARALVQWAKKTGDVKLVLRAQIVALAVRARSALDIAQVVCCARSQVYRVVNLFLVGGRDALPDRRQNNGRPVVDSGFLALVYSLVQTSPREYGFERATWTRELLVIVAEWQVQVRVSVRTMSRVLRAIGARRGRPKPTVAARLSERQQRRRLQAVKQLLQRLQPDEVAVYEDEVDIHLNPHVGLDWMVRGQQKTVLTPGNNQKAYVAGALNAIDGRLTWAGGIKKTSELFVALLTKLEQSYAGMRRIYVILDNYGIHKSAQTISALRRMDRIKLVFLPPYSPDHNRIERLWQDMHANVTRNHQFRTIDELCGAVARWLDTITDWDQRRRPVFTFVRCMEIAGEDRRSLAA